MALPPCAERILVKAKSGITARKQKWAETFMLTAWLTWKARLRTFKRHPGKVSLVYGAELLYLYVRSFRLSEVSISIKGYASRARSRPDTQ